MSYVLVYSDRAAADRDRLYLSRSRHDPDFARRWDKALQDALNDLTDFPGPLSHARDEEASSVYGREVRRLLYYGPTRRRTGTPVRILFTILPPVEPGDEEAVFLLRLLHGPQSLLAPDADPDA